MSEPLEYPLPPHELDVEIKAMRIVLVDDHAANVALLKAVLSSWGFTNFEACTDPVVGLARCTIDPPDLLLLDLHMPVMDGLEVMRRLTTQIKAPVALPVIVLSGQSGPDARHAALQAGARDYLVKPFDANEVRLRVQNALQLRALQVGQRELQEDLTARVKQQTAELDVARLEVVERLARAGEFRDDATGEHTRRVGRTTGLLAERCGVPADLVRSLEIAAPLHDIGKLALPDTLLLKPGRLTAEEFERVKTHTRAGAEILAGTSSTLLELAGEIALSHHERWDGTGYPDAFSGETIPLPGRLVAIADVFDALTHSRPYKPAWTIETALTEMRAQAGLQFDPDALAQFLDLDHAVLI